MTFGSRGAKYSRVANRCVNVSACWRTPRHATWLNAHIQKKTRRQRCHVIHGSRGDRLSPGAGEAEAPSILRRLNKTSNPMTTGHQAWLGAQPTTLCAPPAHPPIGYGIRSCAPNGAAIACTCNAGMMAAACGGDACAPSLSRKPNLRRCSVGTRKPNAPPTAAAAT